MKTLRFTILPRYKIGLIGLELVLTYSLSCAGWVVRLVQLSFTRASHSSQARGILDSQGLVVSQKCGAARDLGIHCNVDRHHGTVVTTLGSETQCPVLAPRASTSVVEFSNYVKGVIPTDM